MPTPSTKSKRINVRASRACKQLLQQAAQASHKSMSEFLLDAGVTAAQETLAARTRFTLHEEEWAQFQQALDRPVQDKVNLRRLLINRGFWG